LHGPCEAGGRRNCKRWTAAASRYEALGAMGHIKLSAVSSAGASNPNSAVHEK
jgi:hypothetical protein